MSLGLGMLSCLRKALDLVDEHYGERYTLATIPPEDPAVYHMLCRADPLGVFQVESRAQMTMLPRLAPRSFYDLVIEVAIVRPGPIQGDMVHPYLRRRRGQEPISYPSKELEAVLSKTLGVPLFQEQAMKIAIVAAGFTPSEADRLRRAMATFKRVGTIGTFQRKMIDGMLANGYEREFAERCFQQIEGFGEYGFPESHAASFALLVYASAWLKCRYPDAFAAALLNAQPMGFYAPAQIVRDAREHGVEVRPPDINHSCWDSTLEPGPRAAERLHELHREMRDDIHTTHAVRLGLREIKGLSEEDGKLIVERRMRSSSSDESKISIAYDSMRDVWLRTGLSLRVLERLADADAFGSLGVLLAVKHFGQPKRWAVSEIVTTICRCSPAAAAHRHALSRKSPKYACHLCRSAKKSSMITVSYTCRCAHIRRNSCGPTWMPAASSKMTPCAAPFRHARPHFRACHLPAEARLGQWRRIHDDRR